MLCDKEVISLVWSDSFWLNVICLDVLLEVIIILKIWQGFPWFSQEVLSELWGRDLWKIWNGRDGNMIVCCVCVGWKYRIRK